MQLDSTTWFGRERAFLPSSRESIGTGLGRAIVLVVLSAAISAAGSARAEAEADPKILSFCGDLRQSTKDLDAKEEKRLELSVTGALTMVEFDGALAYLGLCEAPDPQVLCIAYSTEGLNVGDEVVLSGGLGGYARPDPDHILLDPCLPSAPRG